MVKEKILSVAGLEKSFDKRVVLRGIDLSVSAGECLAIIGASGSGKSTLLRCLNLLELPDSGQLILKDQTYFSDGKLRYQPWEVRRNIGLVFQDNNLFPNMTVKQNISFSLRKTRGLSRAEALHKTELIAHKLGILDTLSQYPNTLSGGQAQRCALARSLVLDPAILLLDEVTSALDPQTTSDVVASLGEVKAVGLAHGTAIILVTHSMQLAREFADRVIFILDGRVHDEFSSAEFHSLARKPETHLFVAEARP